MVAKVFDDIRDCSRPSDPSFDAIPSFRTRDDEEEQWR